MQVWRTGARINRQSRSREYVLGSFFAKIKTILVDPKDKKALGIRADPAYWIETRRSKRQEGTSNRKTRERI